MMEEPLMANWLKKIFMRTTKKATVRKKNNEILVCFSLSLKNAKSAINE